MDIGTISIALGFAAGATQLAGYWVYNKECSEKISTGSWSIWAFAGLLDLASYFVFTGDWVKNILPAVCAAAAFGTFCYAYVRKRLSWPDKVDRTFMGVDVVITVLWYFTSAVVANLLYQVSTVLSFLPMYRGQLSGREVEKPRPWIIWTLAYILFTASVSLRLERWEELAYPLSHVAVHMVTALIAIAKQRSVR